MQSFLSEMAVMQPHGSLNAANAGEFQNQMMYQLRGQMHQGLVVDLSQVESLDSAGLISLVAVLKAARQMNKRFCLMAVPPAIRIVFELTQLDCAFELVEAEAQIPVPVAA